MKSLKLHFESLLDDDDDFYDHGNDKKVIGEWINDNYKINGKLTISDDLVVNCSGRVIVKNKNITSLTNSLFRWGSVGSDFFCVFCKDLKSLEGAPEKVEEIFNCCRCDNLTSLEGAPKKVGGGFYCRECENLTSLEGSPEEVGEVFDCAGCRNLTSLEGGPKKVGGDFGCECCINLKSLKGAPKKVGGGFYCAECKNLEITDSDRKKYKIKD